MSIRRERSGAQIENTRPYTRANKDYSLEIGDNEDNDNDNDDDDDDDDDNDDDDDGGRGS